MSNYIDSIPEGWRFGVLSDLAIVNPSTNFSGVNSDTLVTFLAMANVSENGKITNYQVHQFKEVCSGFTRFQENDVLFAKITPCMENGKGALARKLSNGIGCGSTEFHVLRANEDGDPEFIYHISVSQELREKAAVFFSGSAGQQRVSTDFFEKFSVPIPPFPEQNKIAEILTTVDRLSRLTKEIQGE